MYLSDKLLTVGGLNIWKRLMNDGYKISMYDYTKPGQTLTQLSTIADLEKNMNDQKYRFVLSESSKWVGWVWEFFMIRRTRELAGITLDEQIVNNTYE